MIGPARGDQVHREVAVEGLGAAAALRRAGHAG
jgi:hypothetical protein